MARVYKTFVGGLRSGGVAGWSMTSMDTERGVWVVGLGGGLVMKSPAQYLRDEARLSYSLPLLCGGYQMRGSWPIGARW